MCGGFGWGVVGFVGWGWGRGSGRGCRGSGRRRSRSRRSRAVVELTGAYGVEGHVGQRDLSCLVYLVSVFPSFFRFLPFPSTHSVVISLPSTFSVFIVLLSAPLSAAALRFVHHLHVALSLLSSSSLLSPFSYSHRHLPFISHLDVPFTQFPFFLVLRLFEHLLTRRSSS